MHFLQTLYISFFLLIASTSSCSSQSEESGEYVWDTLQVTASAYNSVEGQTKTGNPALTAWATFLSQE